MNPKISIVVAVYNSEKFLARSIDSIKNQTFEDWECLLIDDGSSDSSAGICDAYAAADGRFKVVHKKNGGVGSARKSGLENATGEYVIHVDSDDWIEPEMLRKLYDYAINSKADVVICDLYRDKSGESILSRQKPSGPDALSSLRDMYIGFGGPVNKLVRRESILKYGVTFPEGSRFMEDLYFFICLFSNPVSVSYLPQAFYHYNMDTNPLSTTNNMSIDAYNSQKDGVLQLMEITSADNLPLLRDGRYVAHTAYRALKIKAHNCKEYRKTYALLYNSNLLYNPELSIHERLILWCSLHFSYTLSVLAAQSVQGIIKRKASMKKGRN